MTTTDLAPVAPTQFTSESSDEDLFRALRTAAPAQREAIQDLLVRRHSGLVRWLASRYANRAVETDELQQVGFVGLVLAIQRFDPDRGSDFTAFAKPTVQGEIRRYFRDKRRWIRLPRRLQETKAALREATDKLTHDLGRSPTVDELAAALAVSPDLVLEAMTADDAFAPLSLDAPAASDEDGSYTIAETVGDAEPQYDLLTDWESLKPLLHALPERERRILQLRFFEDKTQSEIGAELGLSQMHISRLLAGTLARLRSQLQAD
jgi:RNA polymerase sigma-B factor